MPIAHPRAPKSDHLHWSQRNMLHHNPINH
jgi:hypothetical protein